MNRNYKTINAIDLTREELAAWADSRETSEVVALAIHGLADSQRSAESIWESATNAEVDHVRMAVEEAYRHGDYTFDPEPNWGEEPLAMFGDIENDDALKQAIEGVEDNNRTNESEWSDWEGVLDVEEAYNVELCPIGRWVIERAIDSNGESLSVDLPAIERAVWGQNFSGSFWDRSQ